MQVMYRTNLTIVCPDEEARKNCTDMIAGFIVSKRDSGELPGFVGSTFVEDEYLIANGADIEADKAAYELIKKEPITIPISAIKDVPIDLSRVKAGEEPIK